MSEFLNNSGGVSFISFGGVFREILHGFSLRSGGVSEKPFHTLNLGYHVSDDVEAVSNNRQKIASILNYDPGRVVTGRQVHGSNVVTVTASESGRGAFGDESSLPETDGLVSLQPEVVLMAHSADCAILFFYDPVNKSIGLAHGGWRGTVKGITNNIIDTMVNNGSLLNNIHVALSPTIGPCCYKVGAEFAEIIPIRWRRDVIIQRDGISFMDLPGLQRLLLLDAGITEANITKSCYCTCCHTDMFFSYRAEGYKTGRMAGIISLKSEIADEKDK